MEILQPVIALEAVCVKNYLSRSFSVNKTGYFELMSSALASKTETTKMEKRKLDIAMEVLNEVSVEFPETKELTTKKAEYKCSEENISIEEVINFF